MDRLSMQLCEKNLLCGPGHYDHHQPLSRSMESILCEVLSGGITFKGGAAANVSGIMVWFILKLKKLTGCANRFFFKRLRLFTLM
jgi:hypothetical protein